MVTITDSPEHAGFLTFEAFLEARRAIRDAAAADLNRARNRKQQDLNALRQAHEQLLSQLHGNELNAIDKARIRFELGAANIADRKAVNGKHDTEIGEILKRYRLGQSPRKQAVSDFRDYTHATKAHLEDSRLAQQVGLPDPGFDAVLTHLPQTRRRRESGWMVYEVPELCGLAGARELLRCNSTEIVVRGADDDRVRAALLVASQRYSPPLKLDGSERFVQRATAMAQELGLNIVVAGQEARPEPPSAGQPTDMTGSTNDTDSTDPPPPVENEHDYSVQPNDPRLKEIAQTHGARFAVAAGSDLIKGEVVGREAGFWPDADGLLIKMNALAVVVTPIDRSDVITDFVGDTFELRRGDDGLFTVSNRTRGDADVVPDREQAETVGEPVLAQGRGRGR